MEKITRDELKNMNEHEHRDFVLINVLPQEDFNNQHIRTSVNVPVNSENFVEHVESIAGSKTRDIVVYCASFDCNASPTAGKKLEEAGFVSIYDYEGGTKDWFEPTNAA